MVQFQSSFRIFISCGLPLLLQHRLQWTSQAPVNVTWPVVKLTNQGVERVTYSNEINICTPIRSMGLNWPPIKSMNLNWSHIHERTSMHYILEFCSLYFRLNSMTIKNKLSRMFCPFLPHLTFLTRICFYIFPVDHLLWGKSMEVSCNMS